MLGAASRAPTARSSTSRWCRTSLQVIALRARLEELDGIPIININDVPLRGFNSVLKRAIDVGVVGGRPARAVAGARGRSPC